MYRKILLNWMAFVLSCFSEKTCRPKLGDCAVSFAYDRSQARIHTGFHGSAEIGQIYKRDIFLVKKKTF